MSGRASEQRSGFDKLARPYRWLEYLTFGPLLMRCRLHYLSQVSQSRRALVVGDGDGRFTAALLDMHRQVHVDAVDSSAAMLKALRSRASAAHTEGRLATHRCDAREHLPSGPFDLICTHFFLDCLTAEEVIAFVAAARERMPEGKWLVSEFAVPAGLAKWPASVVVTLLYAAFALLTGLHVRSLPDHGRALQANGFTCVSSRTRLCGLLRSELWQIAAGSPR